MLKDRKSCGETQPAAVQKCQKKFPYVLPAGESEEKRRVGKPNLIFSTLGFTNFTL